MNTLRLLLFLALGLAMALAACDGDNDPGPDQNQDLRLVDSSETRGRLFVKVLDTNGNPIDDARVTLYADSEDIDKELFLFEFFSDNRGEVDFGFINFGTFYLFGESNFGDGPLTGRGAVMVFSKDTVRKNLILRRR